MCLESEPTYDQQIGESHGLFGCLANESRVNRPVLRSNTDRDGLGSTAFGVVPSGLNVDPSRPRIEAVKVESLALDCVLDAGFLEVLQDAVDEGGRV